MSFGNDASDGLPDCGYIMLYRHSNYRFDFYLPDRPPSWTGKPSLVTFFMIRNIRYMMPLSFLVVMPKLVKFSYSSNMRRGYKIWRLEMRDDGDLAYEVPSVFGNEMVNLGWLTRYLLPISNCLIIDDQKTRRWYLYVKFERIEKENI